MRTPNVAAKLAQKKHRTYYRRKFTKTDKQKVDRYGIYCMNQRNTSWRVITLRNDPDLTVSIIKIDTVYIEEFESTRGYSREQR